MKSTHALLMLSAFGLAAAVSAQPAGPEFRVNSYTTGSQYAPAAAADSTGSFVIAWQSDLQDGSYEGIYAQRYASTGAPLGGEFRVNTTTTDRQRYPSVAAASAGSFVVVWQSGAYAATYAQRYSSAGAPLGSEVKVNSTGAAAQPSVASDSAGDFVVVWQETSATGVFGQRFSSAGAPAGSQFRVDAGDSTDVVSTPKVAADSTGNFVVVWADNGLGGDGSANGVFGRRFSSTGAPLGLPFQVNTYTTGSQLDASVASDGTGNFTVVWRDESQNIVAGRRYSSAGAPLTGEFRVDTGTFGGEFPSVSSDAAGNFVVTWTDLDGSGLGVLGRAFASTGAPTGLPFRVNTDTTGGQLHSATALASGGAKLVVAWDSQSQDGSSDGVYARRFSTVAQCRNGDVNWDGNIDVADVFYLINDLFAGGPLPICPGDVNGDNSTNVADVFYLINFLFAGGSPPA
jgi:hypothetical protein